MLFDVYHVGYMTISLILSVFILYLVKKYVTEEKGKRIFLFVVALSTVALHYSSLWVDYLSGEDAVANETMLFPVYPCNVMMWLLFIASVIKNRDTTFYKMLCSFLFFGGIICGSIGIIFNENYANTPNLLDWDILKGLLSHSTLLIGCIYVYLAGYIELKVDDVFGCLFGLTFFIADTLVINLLYAICGLGKSNAMYLFHGPLDGAPWFNGPIMGILGLLLVFSILALYEKITLPKEERWYNRYKKYKEEKQK